MPIGNGEEVARQYPDVLAAYERARELPDETIRKIGRMLFPSEDIVPVIADAFGADSLMVEWFDSVFHTEGQWASEQWEEYMRFIDNWGAIFLPDRPGLFDDPQATD